MSLHPISEALPPTAVWAEAAEHLKKVDPRMAQLIARSGAPVPKIQVVADSFEALARAIIHRGWSATMASRAINSLVAKNKGKFPTAGEIVQMTISDIRETGLGEPQARTLWEAAKRVADFSLDLSRLKEMKTDDEVISYLSQLSGVKSWTAKMVLIFHLQRPDVLITGDKGLYRAARKVYPELPEDVDWEAFERLAEKWRPYRSAAEWYLWTVEGGFTPGLYSQPGSPARETPGDSSKDTT